ncbi:MAG TPA: hypothetical protein V6D22_07325 [Candidatus Obscuribacterales bacterium]
MTKTAKIARQSTRKRTSKKTAAMTATCPVGAHGWCSYPFSVTQLQKRMKRIAEGGKTEEELTAVTRSR